MRHMFKLFALSSFVLLSGCASFTGIRSPKYNGETIGIDKEAITLYADSLEVHPDYTDKYFRYELSETLLEPSLPYFDKDSVILEEGTYVVGEDLEAGRVYLSAESSDFSAEMWIIHTGNLTVYDQEDTVVFENHFQDMAGAMQALVDLREGYRIELTGNDPIITVSYSDPVLPKSDYFSEEAIELISGHYEVGEHIEAGTYSFESISVPQTTVLYRFSKEGEVSVFELSSRYYPGSKISPEDNEDYLEWGLISEKEFKANEEALLNYETAYRPEIELFEGDKLYLPMTYSLILEPTDN